MKATVNLTSANAYMTSSKIIQDLKNMFGEFNKVAKSNALFHDPKFGIAIINLKKIIDLFFARFKSGIALLDFIN